MIIYTGKDYYDVSRKAANINATNYRLEFNGELYNILAVNHMNYRKKCIKLCCEKVRR